MADYRLSLGITTGMSNRTTAWIIDNSDKIGAHGIWIGEDIGRGQDIFVLTTAALIGTERARIGTAIVPIAIHDIVSLARATATLYDLSPTRFVFGTGIGGIQDLQKRNIRIKRPVTLLRKTIEAMRRLWIGERVSIEIMPVRIKDEELSRRQPAKVPIFLGVRGPQMLNLAGEIADGVILSGPKQYIKWAIDKVKAAARKAGRADDKIEMVVWNPVVLDNAGGDPNLARKVVAIVLGDTPDRVLDLLGVKPEKIEAIREAVRRGGASHGAALVEKDLIETFCITGSMDTVLEQFAELARIGATEIVVGSPFAGMWRDAIKRLFVNYTMTYRS